MKHFRISIGVLLALSSLQFSCKLRNEDVVGSYVYFSKFNKSDSLYINTDGTYMQLVYSVSEGNYCMNSSSWYLQEHKIIFNDFFLYNKYNEKLDCANEGMVNKNSLITGIFQYKRGSIFINYDKSIKYKKQ